MEKHMKKHITKRKRTKNKKAVNKKIKKNDDIRVGITKSFLDVCEEQFNEDKSNLIAKNAVVSIGSYYASINSDRVNNISHIFLNSIKSSSVKATDQGYSGRCWLFAGLNVFRHHLIKALKLKNFEFSETYLFFWDKLERSNVFLQSCIDNKYELDSREFEHDVDAVSSDGGYWNFFANLVNKYGVVPLSAMPETYQSDNSHNMNKIIANCLQTTACKLYKTNDYDEMYNIKKKTVQQIYDTLVKFLGKPPVNFKWDYICEDDISRSIQKLNPHIFTNMVLPNIRMNTFITLTNIPCKKYFEKYAIINSTNMQDGELCSFVNLPINELKKYAKKSILSGMPVWFGGDVSKGFNPIYQTLDEKTMDNHLLFGDNYKINKSEKMLFKNLYANHAMVLLGVNLDEKDKPVSWQVENSWGYWDHHTPGLDGFLHMSDEWFSKNLIDIVIHEQYLSRHITKLINKEPIMLKQWDVASKALSNFS